MNIKIEIRGEDPYMLYGWLLLTLEQIIDPRKGFMAPRYEPDELSTRVEMRPLPLVEIDHQSRRYLVLRNSGQFRLSDLQRLQNFIPNPLLGITPP